MSPTTFHLGGETDFGEDEVQAVDNLLSQELLQLSLHDRTAMEEEIHGVRCLALEETPQLIHNSLTNLALVLQDDSMIPPAEKEAYLRAMRLPMTYVKTDEFRLRFLRKNLFDVAKAAKDIVTYLKWAYNVFGDLLLIRPFQLSDFSKRELQIIRGGGKQYLPYRDRSGRRVCVIINPKTFEKHGNEAYIRNTMMYDNHRNEKNLQSDFVIHLKIITYMNWVAGEDVDVQRKGIVMVVWLDPSFSVISTNKMENFASFKVKFTDLFSVRTVATHLCCPDTQVYRFIASVARLRNGRPGRLRLKAHFGESVELLYKLQSFGIPADLIPISFSGRIKIGYMKQWTRAREAQESIIYQETGNRYTSIIECPRLSDVLFRQGVSLTRNPGNARIRSLIEEMQDNRTSVKGEKLVKPKRRDMVLDIIEENRKISRFLMWNDGGWWNEIHDQEQLIQKIEYLIKDVRKSQQRLSRRQKLNSDTSMFYYSKNKSSDDNSDDDGQLSRSSSCMNLSGNGCF